MFFFLLSAALAAMVLYRPQEAVLPMRFQIPAPPQHSFVSALNPQASYAGGSISPDGRRVAFAAADATGNIRLWVRPIDSFVAQVLPGTEEAGLPFWSPDSQSIGFGAQGKLKRIDVAGGQPQVLCDASAFRGGAWNRDGVIVFATTSLSPLFRVPATGGAPVQVTTLGTGQTSHRFPVFLPDQKHFIYSSLLGGGEHEIFAASLEKPEGTSLLKTNAPALYSVAGYLLFPRQGALFAQVFDAESLKLSGDPIRIAEQVASDNNALAASVSDTGTLIFRNGLAASGVVQMQWFERNGKPAEMVGSPGLYFGAELSPNGRRIAVHRHEASGGDIWLFDSASGPMSRLTFDASQDNSSPIWSPDSLSIAYATRRDGKGGIYKRSVSGTSSEEVLVEPSDAFPVPMSWSQDGKFLVYTAFDKATGENIWALPTTGDRKPVPLVTEPGNQSLPQVSPDGKWLAYISQASGRIEIYVKTFPTGEGRWQITTTGASNLSIRWRGDSKELYYTTAGQTRDLLAVPMNAEGAILRWGTPERLFDSGYIGIPHPGGGSYHDYSVSPDGKRFLIPRPNEPIAQSSTLPINVVLNWTALLK